MESGMDSSPILDDGLGLPPTPPDPSTNSLGVLGNLGITDNQVSDQQLVTA